MRRSIVIDLVAAVAVAALVLGTGAVAHDKDTFYAKTWRSGDRNQDYGFHSAVPSGDFRDRVAGGAHRWNELAGNMQFSRGGVNVTWTYGSTNCNNPGDNSIHYGEIDGPPEPGKVKTLAMTKHCYYTADPAHLHSFRMKFDHDDPWYRGTGDTPNDKYDLLGVATHEFGHATGFGQFGAQDHFSGGSTYCDSPKHTMCPSISMGADGWSSLEEHDKHTFNNQY